MRLFTTLLASAMMLAGAAAHAETHTYRGDGKFYPKEGEAFSYDETTVFDMMSDTKTKVTSTYTYKRTKEGDEETMTVNYYKVKTQGIHFDVQNMAEQKIGHGYCFGGNTSDRNGKTCHLALETEGMKIEQSSMKRGNKIFSMGSMYKNGMFEGAYKGQVTKQPADDVDGRE